MDHQHASPPRPAPPVWGIDVSKTRLDVVSWPTRQHWQVPNDAIGWTTLAAAAQANGPAGIVLEATGGYEVGIVVALDAVGMTPALVNPLTIRRYAQSHAQLAKTDRIDAEILARYGAERRPVPQPLPSELARDLAALLAERTAVTAQLVALKNRRQQARPLLWDRLDAQRRWLETERRSLDAELAARIADDPAWQARIDQLTSVPGIGVVTATVLAVGLPELGRITGKQAAALVGVAPVTHDSGRLRKARSIRGGRRRVRQALYQALITTIRCEPGFQAAYRALRARGKAHKVAVIACARRLLGILTAMLREGLTWDQTRAAQPALTPLAA